MGAKRTGRCYCGAVRIAAPEVPLTVAFCHCADCRRQSGAPVAAFAAYGEADVQISKSDLPEAGTKAGVHRHFCGSCGSPVIARYDYLPGQVYVPVGLFDDATQLVPALHAHWRERLPWLCLGDDAPRVEHSSRDVLNRANGA